MYAIKNDSNGLYFVSKYEWTTNARNAFQFNDLGKANAMLAYLVKSGKDKFYVVKL